MINKFIQITKNHLHSAQEHIINSEIKHSPKISESLRMLIYDTLFNKTIFLKEYNSHLVYEVVKVPTLGIRIANVIRIYVPIENRGNRVASMMLDLIPEKRVISMRGDHGEVGRLYLSRANF